MRKSSGVLWNVNDEGNVSKKAGSLRRHQKVYTVNDGMKGLRSVMIENLLDL